MLLDRDLNPKIFDFGLAKLDEEENTHISTRILEYDSNEISALKTSRENTVSRVFAKSLTKFCVFGNC